MDNSTSGSKTDDEVGNTGMDSATLAGVVATVISFVALIVSSIQLLYQYYTNVSLNALGARNCNEMVMGPWAKFTRRRWRWLELRFEIIFESPVLFVAPAWNQRGPIPGRHIWYLNGTDESYEETRTPREYGLGTIPTTTATHRGINVEATWVLLLRTLQAMERESAMWLEVTRSTEKCDEPLPFKDRWLAVAAQAQTLSWDFVPNFKKPFATTTICHMVEMAAMLGIHWTMWDATVDRYRAEGNGCLLLGSFNAEQGIVFKFARHDKTTFREHRLVPSNMIKQLCFGFAPTYFVDECDATPEFSPDPMLPLLKLGSRHEIVETLMEIGCPLNVANHFYKEDRVSHLYPVVFDVLGMLGRTASVEGYCYRMLPNPTVFRWDRRWFKTKRLLLVFKEHLSKLNEAYDRAGEVPKPLYTIASILDKLSPQLEDLKVKDYSPPLLDNLRETMKTIDGYLKGPSEDGDWDSPSENLVLETVSHHIASVVRDFRTQSSWFIDLFPLSRADDGVNERILVSFLFYHSRLTAIYELADPASAWADRNNRFTFYQELGSAPDVPPLSDADAHLHSTAYGAGKWRSNARKRDATWCLLVFRMLCWLQLHDFHRDDVMIPRSTTFGSRMPVYIV